VGIIENVSKNTTGKIVKSCKIVAKNYIEFEEWFNRLSAAGL
jgi:hypothetical protein